MGWRNRPRNPDVSAPPTATHAVEAPPVGENHQEFVIGGYRPAASNGIDALLVGYYDDTGLRFAGKVRAGFVPHLRREVFKALKPHQVDDCPSSICRSRSHPAGAAA